MTLESVRQLARCRGQRREPRANRAAGPWVPDGGAGRPAYGRGAAARSAGGRRRTRGPAERPDRWARRARSAGRGRAPDGPAACEPFSAGCSKVAGMGRIRQWLGGQMMMKARPITALSGTVPPPGSPMWSRESAESSRLSPMTHSRPCGTTMLNRTCDGAEPGYRYDCSVSGTPLTVSPALRVAARHPVAGNPDDPLDEDVSGAPEAEHAGKAVSELLEDIAGHRDRARIPGAVAIEDHDVAAVNVADVIHDLVDQNPVIDLRVFSIDPDGIQKAWMAKVLITTASTSATAIRIGSSRQNDRCLRLRRWPGRGPPGPSAGASPGAAAVASAAPSASPCPPAWAFAA